MAISQQAFLSSIPRNSPAAYQPESEEKADESPGIEPDPAIKLLLHSAMVSLEARQWIAKQDAKEILRGRAGVHLLDCCLQAVFDPADASAVQTFLATQPADDQSMLAALIISRPPSRPTDIAKETLQALQRQNLDARREEITARLRQPGLPPEAVSQLQTEVVDITHKIRQLARSQ
jgi:hypothetical protein